MKINEFGKLRKFICFSLLFLAGFFIRLLFLDHSMGHDESIALVYYILPQSSPLDILTTPYRLIVHPLAAFNVSVMKYFFSDSLPILRLPNFILALITFPFLYFFTKRYFGDREAFLVIFILAFSFAHIRFSTETRGYEGMITFSIILLFVTMRIALKGGLWHWLSFILSLIIGAYNHLTTFFLFGVVGFFLTVIFLKDYFYKNRSLGDTSFQLVVLFTSLCIVLATICFVYSYQDVPLAQVLWSKITGTNFTGNNKLFNASFFGGMSQTESNITLGFLSKFITEFSVGEHISSFIQFSLFIIGMFLSWKKNFETTFLLALTIVIPLLSAEIFKIHFAHRYYSYFLIPYWIFMAVAGVSLFDFMKNKIKENQSRRSLYSFCAGYLFLFVWIYVPSNVWFGPDLHKEIFTRLTDGDEFSDIKAVRDYLKNNKKERDIILNISNIALPPDGSVYRYYLKKYYKQHALENIFFRGNGVRVWYIGNLDKRKQIPYWFPESFNPKKVDEVSDLKIYLDENVSIWADSLSEDVEKSSPFWLFLKGWHMGRIGKYSQAIMYFDQFVKIPNVKNIRRGYNNLGLMWLNLGKPDLAVENLRKAIAADPELDNKDHMGEFSAPLFYLGVILCSQAMMDESIVGKLKYKEGLHFIKQGIRLWKSHENQNLFNDALNGKVVDFSKVKISLNVLVNPLEFYR